jgi:hypothetical protein
VIIPDKWYQSIDPFRGPWHGHTSLSRTRLLVVDVYCEHKVDLSLVVLVVMSDCQRVASQG